MSKNIDTISDILKHKIKNFELKLNPSEEGKVISIADGIASVSGLNEVQIGEILVFDGGLEGVALNLEPEYVGVILLGKFTHIKEGGIVKRTNRLFSLNYGDDTLGRIINPLGNPIDGGTKINANKQALVERPARDIMERQHVNQPLETGILAIDSIIPIGKGQRELIIGDRKTGKTAIGIDAIINQKGKDVKCVYVSIGQKNSTLSVTVEKLRKHGAMKYTTVVAANASDNDALIYYAPYAGIALAEEWMNNGDDVLIVFDDLTKHAVAYRTISLLLRRPPGREAYPGDVFYLHSRLLERSAKLRDDLGGGSITALPIIETQAGDISAYIPTNVISITDGQIFLMSDTFNAGQRPAVDAGFSVSRVGSTAQTKLMKKMSSSLKLELANYNELKSFSEFSSDLDDNTKAILDKGAKIMELLKQEQYLPYEQTFQATLLFMIKENLISKVDIETIGEFKKKLLEHTKKDSNWINLFKLFKKQGDITDEQVGVLKDYLNQFITMFKKGTIISK